MGRERHLAADTARFQELAAAAPAVPVTINLALISRRARCALLVVPDGWPDETVAAVAGSWGLLSQRLVRCHEYRPDDATPVVAFGSLEENLPVAAWCLAVATQRPDAAPHLEIALRLTHSYAVLDGTRRVAGDRVPIALWSGT